MKWLVLLLFFMPFSLPGQTLKLKPVCVGKKMFVQVIESEKMKKGKLVKFGIFQNGKLLAENQTGRFQIFPKCKWEGEGFTIYRVNGFENLQSDPFQILGKPVGNEPPLYANLTIDGLAFVHSNIQLTDACTIKAGARVYNRGQMDNADFDGTNNPTVSEVKWTVVDNDATSLTIEGGALITAACDRMWQGIEFLSANNSVLPVSIQSGAEISHAFKAISLPEVSGKINLQANGAMFTDNFISAEIEQVNLTNCSFNNCVFNSSQLLAPFIGTTANPITSRFGINLVKGNGSSGTSYLQVRQCQFGNLFIGIHSYGGSVSAEQCIFNAMRYKGINFATALYSTPLPSVTGCQFNFSAGPHLGWARTTTAYCCGDQNLVPGQEELNIAYLDKGLYGISSFVALNEVSGNTFTQTENLPYDRPTIGLIEPAYSQTRSANTFTGLDYGMLVPSGTASTTTPYSLTGNTFSSNGTGIYLDNGTFNLELRCNIFETDENLNEEERVGLQMGETAVIVGNKIGGNGGIDQPLPNANIWPWVWDGTAPNQTKESPANWTSISKMDAGSLLDYFHYTNEIVDRVFPSSGAYRVRKSPNLSAASPKVVKTWCETHYPALTNEQLYLACLADPTDPVLTGEAWDIQTQGVPSCYELLDDEVDYFARQAVSQNTTQVNVRASQMQGYLGEAEPNPSSRTCSIPIIWNQDKGKLVVFDLASGKEVWSRLVATGRQKIEIDVSKLASGVYGYRLEGDCPCPEPKRLVVVH